MMRASARASPTLFVDSGICRDLHLGKLRVDVPTQVFSRHFHVLVNYLVTTICITFLDSVIEQKKNELEGEQ